MRLQHAFSWSSLTLMAALSLTLIAGCNGGGETPTAKNEGAKQTGDTLTVDGSSTVYPIVSLMGEDFKASNGADVTVNKSGTGSGMNKFSRGEIEIATASRPIKDEEIEALQKAKIEFLEIPIAYDGVCVIVSKENTLVKQATPEELTKLWEPGSKIKTWADWQKGLPAAKINFYGPSDNHGTYEYFTEAVTKKKGAIREDYQANQEYNAIVTAVAGDKNGIAYVGYNYFAENTSTVSALGVDAGNGPVAPTAETIMDGSYTPLSRPLFLYVSKKAYDSKPEVKAFVEFALSADGMKLVEEAKYVPLPQAAIDAIKANLAAGTTGSKFKDVKPGLSIQQVLSQEKGG